MSQLSLNQAAQLMGVSTATIRNWVKAGHLTPMTTHPLTFSPETVRQLKNQIGSATFSKLTTRANKAGSNQHFLPKEYTKNSPLTLHIREIVSRVILQQLDLEKVMFLAALRLLEMKGEVLITNHDNIVNISTITHWKRSAVHRLMAAWFATLPKTDSTAYQHLYPFITPTLNDDFLGLLYQSLSHEGNKSQQGSYYTPTQLVETALAQFSQPIQNFLDPCCGSGQYLLGAAKTFQLAPESIWGFDCDKIATRLASINLLLAYPHQDFTPHIFCLDTLTEMATGEIFHETNALLGQIEAIATNPPWGAYKNVASKTLFSSQIKSGETFALFLEKACHMLAPNGQLSFLLPESILKIKIHADIRELILQEMTIKRIVMLERPFTGVFTPVIRLDLVKQTAPHTWQLSVEQENQTTPIVQARFKKNNNFIFDVTTVSQDEELLEKIYAVEHVTLAQNALWALGIVTGNNKKYLLETAGPGTEAILKGSDVFAYRLGNPQTFLYFTPQAFQQVAPEHLFRAPEKLIYKFISNKLVFAYDNQQHLTLNSANIVIPTLPHFSVKVALAFLNSSVFQYIFRKKFATHKVLRGDLEKLPFPILDKTTHQAIEELVEVAIKHPKTPPQLDDIIFKVFRLNQTDIITIKSRMER